MKLTIVDDLPPESLAMLQALYSRSAASVTEHLQKVEQTGAANFMSRYYVGYGHASIGDCGVTTLFLEGVSVLAAKAVQDNQLYSGQETSTRYIDFKAQGCVDPVGSPESRAILKDWMDFYAEAEAPVRAHVQATVARPEGTKDSVWDKAVAARAFDILRGFLPAGVRTQLSWTTNLRQAADHLARLRGHPLAEVRALGEAATNAVEQRYPNSFGHAPDGAVLDYAAQVAELETYDPPRREDRDAPPARIDARLNPAAWDAVARAVLADRPRRAALPKSLARLGTYHCRVLLDFGSFRDLQRHRGGMCRMPLLTTDLEMHPWYLAQLPPALRDRADALIARQAQRLAHLARQGTPAADLQYLIPMGYRVAVDLIYDLPQLVYVIELRSGATVHATLRALVLELADQLGRLHPDLALHVDRSPDQFSIKRGSQDIVERPAAAV